MAVNTSIHPTAVVHPSAIIEPGVIIEAYAYIGPNVRIGEGSYIHTHAIIMENVIIGKNCQIFPGAVIGAPPQDTRYKGEKTSVIIGDNNIIREFVTIHRALGEGSTEIGSNNLLMAYSHIGHNCKVGNGVVMSNYVGISGHVVIEDNVTFGGIVGVHQWVTVGKLAMVGGYSKVVQDVPPFMIVDGRPAKVVGPNKVGLRRAGIPPAVRNQLKKAFLILFHSKLPLGKGIIKVQEEIPEQSEELKKLLEFVNAMRQSRAGRQLERLARRRS
ncbi:acyl-ACP--UDP-N-acetylglucosamine O-acyltransferase [bacterium]|nr:acyl-ACP--UDP-N-acetylglucosamine O-acyltransferase [bacterium]